MYVSGVFMCQMALGCLCLYRFYMSKGATARRVFHEVALADLCKNQSYRPVMVTTPWASATSMRTETRARPREANSVDSESAEPSANRAETRKAPWAGFRYLTSEVRRTA